MQNTSTILMIRPIKFQFNEETADNNAFQDKNLKGSIAQNEALNEFDAMVESLKNAGVEVIVIEDTPEPHTPDSIFPNNWVSFHQDGNIVLYPMYAPNRRLERRMDILEKLKERFQVNNLIDFSEYEAENLFLEGTGSLILDRENKIAYVSYSQRRNDKVLDDFSEKLGYTTVRFSAKDQNGMDIYHTNVLMCLGDRFSVICLDTITNQSEREDVVEALTKTNKEIIDISFAQMNQFAGNMLQVHNKKGESLLCMSEKAYRSLTSSQIETLKKYTEILFFPIHTIENNGGGSVRCMMAEVFLPEKSTY